MTTSDCCPSHISLLVLSRQGFFRKKRVTENIPWNHSSPSVVILGVTPLTLISPIRGPSLLILEEGFSRLGVDHATFWLEEGLLSLLLTRGGETGLSGGPGELVRGLARADPPTLALRLVVGGGAGRSPPPWLFRLRPDIKKHQVYCLFAKLIVVFLRDICPRSRCPIVRSRPACPVNVVLGGGSGGRRSARVGPNRARRSAVPQRSRMFRVS